MTESLKDFSKRVRAALAAGDTGPLVVAADVISVAGDWERHREETGGLSCTSWLRKEFGPGHNLAWFTRRHEAVLSLGESVRRTMHHEVAVWIVDAVPADKHAEVVMAVTIAAKKQHGVPLTPPQARRIVCPLIGKVRGRKPACIECAKHEREIARLRALLAGLEGKDAAE